MCIFAFKTIKNTYCHSLSVVKQLHYDIRQAHKTRYTTHIEVKKCYISRAVQIEMCLYQEFAVNED